MNEQQQPAPSVPDGWQSELLDWVSACQSAYHIDSTPGHRFGGLGSNLEENRAALVEYMSNLLTAAQTPAEAPADVARWIDPNDKTQKQYLPHVGERVLFCHDGRTYYGKHTGGSFISFTHPGNTYPTWGCHWMYPPKATDAAMS